MLCERCEESTDAVWEMVPETRTDTIRRLNDALRRGDSADGTILITSGLQAKGVAFVEAVISAVAAFDAFTADNDPYGEHDFGALDVEGERVLFKIDACDLAMTAASSDPNDPAVTHRAMTIMLACEY